ncbi:MAG: peptide deformylase [Rhizobiaceae bacterium]|nr:peptide deformylase [Rhizobiaceae bacterium]MBL4695697.1 peptide deformylase [Rhizobiaceae bacterium]
MSLRPIINIPDPLLRMVSKPVEQIDDAVLKLLDDMLETMYEAPGIGLAGIQIAVPLRIITLDVAVRSSREDGEEEELEEEAEIEPEPMFLINPEIVSFTEEPSVYEEGCLSIPDYYADVERPAGCTVKFLDRDGKEHIIEATGLLSTVVQHEVDHLDGKLFVDHISKLKRDMVIKKFTKIAKQNGTQPAEPIII